MMCRAAQTLPTLPSYTKLYQAIPSSYKHSRRCGCAVSAIPNSRVLRTLSGVPCAREISTKNLPTWVELRLRLVGRLTTLECRWICRQAPALVGLGSLQIRDLLCLADLADSEKAADDMDIPKVEGFAVHGPCQVFQPP